MKVLFLTEPLIFSLIPRAYPAAGDNISISLRNEQTDAIIEPSVSFTVTDKLNITIETQPLDFQSQNKYELIVKNGSELIYLGKAIILNAGSDVQNYENSTQQNEKFGYR